MKAEMFFRSIFFYLSIPVPGRNFWAAGLFNLQPDFLNGPLVPDPTAGRGRHGVTGLSMGGLTTLHISGQNKDLVGSISAFRPAANLTRHRSQCQQGSPHSWTGIFV